MADETTGAWMDRRPISPTPNSPARDEDGLYDSRFEHDSCGVGMVADLSGRRVHSTVAQALSVLRNLDHRGAKGADHDTGDGAGILTQIPDEFFRAVCGFLLPPPGFYAAGLAFVPPETGEGTLQRIEQLAGLRSLVVLG
jgi:glutamate synthase (NADPH/NADH) large chain